MKNLFKFKFLSLVIGGIILLSGCVKQVSVESEKKLLVGFDVDDTLLFSTPAFKKGFQSDTRPFSPEFWEVVNKSDRGNSIVKKKTQKILIEYQQKGDEIFVITARHPDGGESLKEFLNETFNILKENIYFETSGKTLRMRQLKLDIFYGDADSDITAAQDANVKAYRIQRSTASSYQKKYNPGKYGEEVIPDSEW